MLPDYGDAGSSEKLITFNKLIYRFHAELLDVSRQFTVIFCISPKAQETPLPLKRQTKQQLKL